MYASTCEPSKAASNTLRHIRLNDESIAPGLYYEFRAPLASMGGWRVHQKYRTRRAGRLGEQAHMPLLTVMGLATKRATEIKAILNFYWKMCGLIWHASSAGGLRIVSPSKTNTLDRFLLIV
jgi:hypothetical protein